MLGYLSPVHLAQAGAFGYVAHPFRGEAFRPLAPRRSRATPREGSPTAPSAVGEGAHALADSYATHSPRPAAETHVECGSLLPPSAAGACPGVLPAPTDMHHRPHRGATIPALEAAEAWPKRCCQSHACSTSGQARSANSGGRPPHSTRASALQSLTRRASPRRKTTRRSASRSESELQLRQKRRREAPPRWKVRALALDTTTRAKRPGGSAGL
jgi:hypothetical protein